MDFPACQVMRTGQFQIESLGCMRMSVSRCALLAAAFLMATVMVSPMHQDLPLCVMHWAIFAPELSET